MVRSLKVPLGIYGMSDKKYWTSFAALKNKEEIDKRDANEFNEDLPFGDIDDKGYHSITAQWLSSTEEKKSIIKCRLTVVSWQY